MTKVVRKRKHLIEVRWSSFKLGRVPWQCCGQWCL